MLPNLKTHISRRVFLLMVLIGLPVAVLANPSEEELTETRDEFNQLWHAAAETTKRRSTLEASLATFDTRVADAKRDLEKAAVDRKAVRERIAQHRIFVEALQGQIQAADEAQAFYTALALSQKDDFVRFLQYMMSKDIAIQESGPAAGGDLFKLVLRGSLGDSVDDALAREAVIKARGQFLGQVRVLVSESDRVQERLRQVAIELDREMKALEAEHRSISSIVEEKAGFIDSSWKEKKLTEDELALVAAEAAEASERLAAIQESLHTINDQLKSEKTEDLTKERALLAEKQAALEAEQASLQRRESALSLLVTAAEEAYRTATALKNTDKKLYRRIEEKELFLANAQAELAALKEQASAASGATADVLASIREIEYRVNTLSQTLKYMREGFPADEAEAFVIARAKADASEAELRTLREKLTALAGEMAVVAQDISAKDAEIAAVEEEFALAGLPPLFVWPVKGPVSAGFLDPDYVNVFHVPHRGMDIAVAQATPVRSISDGVVLAVKDGGLTGYSYVVVGHRNGYASLYGHVSTILVKTGDRVSAGQMIALSGGKPGTRGAGTMTTGSHLHLEITKDGAHVDPAGVLPAR